MRNTWAFRFTLCALCFCMNAIGLELSRAQTEVPFSGRVTIFPVKTEYGTLGFRGQIERTDLGDRYKYRIQVATAFLPGEKKPDGSLVINRTKIADLTQCELVASERVATWYDGNYRRSQVQVLYREVHPIAVRLTEFGDVALLPDLEFYLAKAIANRATHIGLAVSSKEICWPLSVELK